ncbi:MAG: hypothetical protein K2R93_05590 [Gemmatimonadaceae bacterium]|nr:hypothetical protein [Gemmatimonadaceae bacterium]
MHQTTRTLILAALAMLSGACTPRGYTAGGAADVKPRPEAPKPKVVADNPNVRRAVLSDNSGVMYSDAPLDQMRTIAAAPATVLAATRGVFAGFMIPVTLDDPATKRVGNADFYRSREFMGKRMVELVDCGGGITGPNALTYRIYMSLIVRVKDAPNGQSAVSVQLLATGKDLASGNGSDRIPCGSSGKIEQRLLDEIEKRVKAP